MWVWAVSMGVVVGVVVCVGVVCKGNEKGERREKREGKTKQ